MFSSSKISSFGFYSVGAADGGHFHVYFFFLLMEDSLVQYTAVIGLFNCLKFVSCFIVFFGFFFCLQYHFFWC